MGNNVGLVYVATLQKLELASQQVGKQTVYTLLKFQHKAQLVLEIPNDAHITLRQNLIGCSTNTQSRVLQAGWLL